MIDSLEKERKEFEAAGTKLHGGGRWIIALA